MRDCACGCSAAWMVSIITHEFVCDKIIRVSKQTGNASRGRKN